MLKEILGGCSQEDADVLTDVANRYPVAVDISPYNPEVVTPHNPKKYPSC